MTDAMPVAGLRDLLAEAGRRWWLIVLVHALCWGLALIALRTITPAYTAHLVVGPTASSGVISRGVRQVPNASRAQTMAETVEGEQLSDFSRFLHLLTAPDLAEHLAADATLMRRIFAAEWDAESGSWQPPGGVGAFTERAVAWLAGRQSWSPPDAYRLAGRLGHDLSIARIGETPMRRLSFRHEDRDFAMRLLTRIHAAAEAELRGEAARRTEAEIAFLEQELGRVTRQSRRTGLVSLLSEEQTAAMMIALELPLAADIIEGPSAPPRPDWPDPLIVLAGAQLMALLVSGIVSLAFAERRLRRKRWLSAAARDAGGVAIPFVRREPAAYADDD